MRMSQRLRLEPDGTTWLIGRGGPAEFARHFAARENARLLRFALVHLSLALALLVALGLRPFA
jgi:hypothetical protein